MTLLSLPLILSFSATGQPLAADALIPKHVEGRALVRTIAISRESELVDSSMTQNGEEGPGGMDMARSSAETANIEVIDRVTELEDGAIAAFERSYEEGAFASEFHMSMDGEMGGMDPVDEENEGNTPLEGEIVRFALVDGDLAPIADDDLDLEDGDLDRLPIDLSLLDLLPQDGEDPKNGWEIAPDRIESLLSTDSYALPPREEHEEGMMMATAMGTGRGGPEPEFDGAIALRVVETREVDGRQMLAISIKVDCTSSFSFEPQLMAPSADGEEDEVMDGDFEASVEESYEGEGTALWDIEGGYFASVELDIEWENSSDHTLNFADGPGGEMTIESTETEEGAIEYRYSCGVL